MSETETSVSATACGRAVDENEQLYRAIMHPSWWVPAERRISSAAFKRDPVFSVDVASISGSPEATLARFLPGTGLASFACRVAIRLGLAVRIEPDPLFPENDAHAHVYMPTERKNRMKIAMQLAQACSIVKEPDIEVLTRSIEQRAMPRVDEE